MIKILKDGVIPKITKVMYKATCQNCGCVFVFENGDIKSQERCINGRITVECPYCHKDIMQSSSEYETVLVEVEDE